MLRGAKNTVQGAKMAFDTPFLATCIGVALTMGKGSDIQRVIVGERMKVISKSFLFLIKLVP